MGEHSIIKEKKPIYQKWWFWICIVFIILIIGITSIIIVSIKTTTSGISGVALQIQDIYKDATLYGSAGENTLILELKHINEDNAQSFDYISDISNIIKDNYETELSTFNELILIAYIDYETVENIEIVHMTYILPDFKEKNTQVYIDEDYLQTSITDSITDMFNNY